MLPRIVERLRGCVAVRALGVMTKRHVFGTDYRADFRFYTVTPLIPT